MKSSNVKSSGFNNSKVGTNKVTVTYLGKSISFDVNIKKRNVKKVKVTKTPKKTEYNNEEKLDLEGGTVIVEYNDNTKEEISMDSPNVEVSQVNNGESEDTVVVKYDDKKTSFSIKKILSYFDEIFEEDDDFDVDYSEYGEFYDAVKMKPKEVIMTIGIIFALSILLYFGMKKVR